jgi:CheY-like chemotaxis protein
LNCWVPTIQNHADQLEVFRYLIKPVDRETLLSTLQEVGRDISNVLLVDDNPEVIKLFGRILTSGEKKYRILRATSGPQALEMLRLRKPDVMILDLIMPEMSGFQVLEEKGRDPCIRDIPVLVITSRDPSNTPIVSDILNIWREGGFSIQDLLNSITALSESLIPRTEG